MGWQLCLLNCAWLAQMTSEFMQGVFRHAKLLHNTGQLLITFATSNGQRVPDRMLQSDQPSAIFSNPTESPCIWAPRRKALASCRPNVTGALRRTLPICELIKKDRYAAGSVVGPLPLRAEIRNPPLWWSDSWPWSTSFMRAL